MASTGCSMTDASPARDPVGSLWCRMAISFRAALTRHASGPAPAEGRAVGLRVVIGLAFAIILVATTGALLFFGERALSELRSAQVDQQFEAVASLARSQLTSQVGSADVVLDTLAMSGPYTGASEDAAVSIARVLSNLRETSPAVLATFVAFEDGSFSLARKVTAESAEKAKAAGAPGGAAFELQVGEPRGPTLFDRFIYLDQDYNVVARSGPFPATYDSRDRPWYRRATEIDRATITPPYRFQDYPYTGLTLSRHAVRSRGTVFGIDMTLADLSAELARSTRFTDEQVILFSGDGLLIAGSDLGESIDLRAPEGTGEASPAVELARRLYAAYRADPRPRTTSLDAGGRPVLADFVPVNIADQSFVLASALPLEVIQEPIERWARVSLAVQVGVALLALYVATWASRRISGPILALASEVERIVAFRFEDAKPIRSRVWEVRRLAAAIQALEVALRAFSSYLPAQFVQGIVARRALPTLGGRKQTVVVMFSDIFGFTTISEKVPPDRLMAQLSRYFAVIAEAVTETGGTVDKYIGDSVMAFWPDEDDGDAARRACRAALDASSRLDDLDAEFLGEGLPTLPTRFGLHRGEAMLGNIGAQDRMNYTVLGHTVNVASRIEGLNKTYGTTLLASGPVHAAASTAFDFRRIDTVAVRGATGAIEIFELLGATDTAGCGQPA